MVSKERKTIVEMELEGKKREKEGLEKIWLQGEFVLLAIFDILC